jgi:HEPN domain-containing protein
VRKDTANWIALADYDIETARHMLSTGRYLYVIFLSHLALEKLLKAYVAEITETVPIKTQDLIYLFKNVNLRWLKTNSTSLVKLTQPVFPPVIQMICSVH